MKYILYLFNLNWHGHNPFLSSEITDVLITVVDRDQW